MSKKILNVYQFKITLEEIKPRIWRCIQVPENYSFLELHSVIQDAMGWEDCHLHQFEMLDSKTGLKAIIGMPDEFAYSISNHKIILEVEAKIANYFLSPKDKALYEYDFGNGWCHEIVLEKIVPAEKGVKYPVCISGKRHCPPENCGGTRGYAKLLKIIFDPRHPEYEEKIERLGGDFDPEDFTSESVEFYNPKKRYKEMFE